MKTPQNPKNIDFIKKKHAYLSLSAVMFSKQFLAYTVLPVHIDWFA